MKNKEYRDGDIEAMYLYFDSISYKRKEQKLKYRRVKDVYYGKYDDHYEYFFTNIIYDFANNKTNLPLDNPLFTRDVVNSLALVYRETPERSFTINGEPVEEAMQDYITSIYDGIGNAPHQTLNKMSKALSTNEFQIYYADGKIKGRVITPDSYDVIQDPEDPQNKKAIIYEIYSSDSLNREQQQEVTFIYWTDKIHKRYKLFYRLSTDATVTTFYPVDIIDETESDINPYGCIPFIRMVESDEANNYFQDENANIFINAETILTAMASGKAQSYLYQGFNILTYTTGAPHKINNMRITPSVMQILQKGSQSESDDRIEFVSSSDMLTPVTSAYKETYLDKLKIWGIEGQGDATSNQSGVSIALSKDQQNKVINSDREKYSAFEQEQWELIKKVNNYHAQQPDTKDMIKIPEEIEISVEFKEITTSLTTQEQIDWEQHNIDNKIWGFKEIYKSRNPDASDSEIDNMVKEAEEREARVVAIDMTEIENADDGREVDSTRDESGDTD